MKRDLYRDMARLTLTGSIAPIALNAPLLDIADDVCPHCLQPLHVFDGEDGPELYCPDHLQVGLTEAD